LLVGPTEPNMTYFTSFPYRECTRRTRVSEAEAALFISRSAGDHDHPPLIPAPSSDLPASFSMSTPAAEPAVSRWRTHRRHAIAARGRAPTAAARAAGKDNLTSVVHSTMGWFWSS